MNGIQLDLFTFAAMQIQEKSAEAKPTVVLKNFINDGKYPIPTVKSERIAANLKAIRLLKSLSDERPLEYDEQITLSRFTGWGGLTDVFMEDDPHFAELKELLTKEEYETAESSILDSYYTPENIIEFMWTLARQVLQQSRRNHYFSMPEIHWFSCSMRNLQNFIQLLLIIRNFHLIP